MKSQSAETERWNSARASGALMLRAGSQVAATQAELCPSTVCVTSELRRAVEEKNERMKDSEKAVPNDRDKSRYGENRQVRASADARKWKRMIEYVTLRVPPPPGAGRADGEVLSARHLQHRLSCVLRPCV